MTIGNSTPSSVMYTDHILDFSSTAPDMYPGNSFQAVHRISEALSLAQYTCRMVSYIRISSFVRNLKYSM